MTDLDGRTSEAEDLIRAVHKLSLAVERLASHVDSRFDAFERQMSDRFETVEHQVDGIGSGLAVVLKRSEDNREEIASHKKKLPGWRGLFALSTTD